MNKNFISILILSLAISVDLCAMQTQQRPSFWKRLRSFGTTTKQSLTNSYNKKMAERELVAQKEAQLKQRENDFWHRIKSYEVERYFNPDQKKMFDTEIARDKSSISGLRFQRYNPLNKRNRNRKFSSMNNF